MTDVHINKIEEKMIRGGDVKGAFESMFTRFNRLVQASGIFKELKRLEFYEKPSVARSRKKRNKLIKSRQQERKNALRKSGKQRVSRPRNRRTDKETQRGHNS